MNNDNEQALSKLEKAYELGFREKWLVDIDGRLDSLRNLPGFLELQAKIGDEMARALATVRSEKVAVL